MSEHASTYDALAPNWETWADAVTPPLRLEWASKADQYVEAGARVVELGCGTGAPIGRHLAARYDYTGVDASPGMLAQARAALPDAQFVHSDMEDATFAAGSLGGAFAFYSIIHVPRERHAALFGAIASWLRPGGVFVGTLHSRDDPDDFTDDWLGAGPMRWSGFDRATNLRMLTEAGFAIIEEQVIPQIEPGNLSINPLWVCARRS